MKANKNKNKKMTRKTTEPTPPSNALRNSYGKIERPCPFNHKVPFFAPAYNLKRHMAGDFVKALLEVLNHLLSQEQELTVALVIQKLNGHSYFKKIAPQEFQDISICHCVWEHIDCLPGSISKKPGNNTPFLILSKQFQEINVLKHQAEKNKQNDGKARCTDIFSLLHLISEVVQKIQPKKQEKAAEQLMPESAASFTEMLLEYQEELSPDQLAIMLSEPLTIDDKDEQEDTINQSMSLIRTTDDYLTYSAMAVIPTQPRAHKLFWQGNEVVVAEMGPDTPPLTPEELSPGLNEEFELFPDLSDPMPALTF